MKHHMESSYTYPLTVTVSIDPNTGLDSVDVTPHDATITGPNCLMLYTLATPGYVFRSEQPIVFAQPSGQFPCEPWFLSVTELALYNKNSKKGDHPYTVYVTNTSSGKDASVDPMVANDGHGPSVP
jgi:hypothetical protein